VAATHEQFQRWLVDEMMYARNYNNSNRPKPDEISNWLSAGGKDRFRRYSQHGLTIGDTFMYYERDNKLAGMNRVAHLLLGPSADGAFPHQHFRNARREGSSWS
jgi:hypothetical protein